MTANVSWSRPGADFSVEWAQEVRRTLEAARKLLPPGKADIAFLGHDRIPVFWDEEQKLWVKFPLETKP